MSNSASLYTPLDATRSEIRLIDIVHPGSETQPVKCTLRKVSLEDEPVFVALSYVWGHTSITKNIELDDRTVPVTTNLASALYGVQQTWASLWRDEPEKRLPLFVDALCINQEDVQERNAQVQLMGRVYTSAWVVFSWIGSDRSRDAVHVIQEIAKAVRSDDSEDQSGFFTFEWMKDEACDYLCMDDHYDETSWIHNKAWDSLQIFLEDVYWQRIWVFQEVVLARKLIILAPETITDWESILLVCRTLQELKARAEQLRIVRPKFIDYHVWSAITSGQLKTGAIVQLQEIRNDFRRCTSLEHQDLRGDSEALRQILATVIYTVISRGQLQATDPKDYVYGLLGISGIPILPDYSDAKSVSSVYCELVVSLLDMARRQYRVGQAWAYPLIFLSLSGLSLPTRTPGLPTWTPKYSARGGSSYQVHEAGVRNRTSLKVHEDFYLRVDLATTSLFVWGAKVDTVAYLNETSGRSSRLERRWLTVLRRICSRTLVYGNSIPPLQALLRLMLLVVDIAADWKTVIQGLCLIRWITTSTSSTSFTLEVCQPDLLQVGLDTASHSFDREFMDLLLPGMDLGSWGIPDLRSILVKGIEGPIGDVWGSFFTAMLRTIEWTYFETANGYMGIAPQGVATDDAVCFLGGCDVPVLLRLGNEGECMQLVSTAYVVGMMDGEVSEILRSELAEHGCFELR